MCGFSPNYVKCGVAAPVTAVNSIFCQIYQLFGRPRVVQTFLGASPVAGLLGAFFGQKMALTHMGVWLPAMKVIASGGLWFGGWMVSAAGAFNRR